MLTSVALIDDHILFRRGLRYLINDYPSFVVVNESSSGSSYQQAFTAAPAPDIVLLDLLMPGLSGLETMHWIRHHQPQSQVLVVSSISSEMAVVQLLLAGAVGYHSKDFGWDTLQQTLLQIRDRKYHFSAPGVYTAALTQREIEFMKLACSEKTYREIAQEMMVSIRTVDACREQLFKKLGIVSRSGLVLYAVRNGIVMM